VAFTFSVNGLTVRLSNKTPGAYAWTWTFGDGSSSTARKPSHTYAAAGTYDITLTAVGADGASASVTHEVTVGG
jgi:serine protease